METKTKLGFSDYFLRFSYMLSIVVFAINTFDDSILHDNFCRPTLGIETDLDRSYRSYDNFRKSLGYNPCRLLSKKETSKRFKKTPISESYVCAGTIFAWNEDVEILNTEIFEEKQTWVLGR